MKFLKILFAVLVALAAVVALAAPIGPLPGVFIGGTDTPAPAAWPDTSNVHEIRLKVSGGLPRVVIIWVAEHDGELHVVGDPGSGWVQKIGVTSPVELRLGDNTYAVQAVPVTESRDAILEAWLDKYAPHYPEIVEGFRARGDAAANAAVFRLERG